MFRAVPSAGRIGGFLLPSTALTKTIPSSTHRRTLAVYAVGEGWTGALGTGRLDDSIPGHFDDEEGGFEYAYAGNEQQQPQQQHPSPYCMYDGPVLACSVGWAHTVIITAPSSDNDDDASTSKLLVTGRPHDFAALLRLNRLPKFMRDYSVRRTADNCLTGDDPSRQKHYLGIIDPGFWVGILTTWLIKTFQNNDKDDKNASNDPRASEQEHWEMARRYSSLTKLTEIKLPAGDSPVQVACSAGWTACLGASGKVYTFGLNNFGQCGVGYSSNNVWEPTAVTGLSTEHSFGESPRHELAQTFPMKAVATGLQHGVSLSSAGQVFCWGKGTRGQLGQPVIVPEAHTALPIRKVVQMLDKDNHYKPTYMNLEGNDVNGGGGGNINVTQIATGMLHSAALTTKNQVLLWGKNILPTIPGSEDEKEKKVASDARLPIVLEGLPSGLKVEQISCGSHHTSVLLEDGSVWSVGISTDGKEPIHEPVVMIPAGIIEMPVRHFVSHMDRTTVVGNSGRQVLEAQLWQDSETRVYAVSKPAWIERWLEELPTTTKIREIHRSWQHTCIITDEA